MKKQKATPKARGGRKQAFPRGWNESRVKDLVAYYDKQTAGEELAEYEAALSVEGQTMMLVPTQLVPEIRSFISRRRGA